MSIYSDLLWGKGVFAVIGFSTPLDISELRSLEYANISDYFK